MPLNSKIVITAVDKTSKAFTSVDKKLGAARNSLNSTAKALGVMGGLAATTLGVMYTKSAQAGDQLAKTADKLGITTEALTSLQYAGELTGVSVQTTNMALQRMTRRLAEAAQGTGEAKGAIKELGLDAQKLAAMSPDQAFKALSESMKGVGSQSDKVRLAMKLFDSEGVSLVNTMALGADGLDKARAEAEALGITLSRVDAAKMEAANDAMYKAGQVGTAFGNRITTELAPIVNGLATEFLGVAKEAGGFGEIATEALDFVVKGVGLAANVVRGLQVSWDGVKLVVAGVTSTIVSGMAAADRAVTWFLNKLPGVEAAPSQMLENLDHAFKSVYDDIYNDLQELVMKPLPYDGVVKWAKEAQSKANTAAEKVAAESGNRISTFDPAVSASNDETDDKDDKDDGLTSFQELMQSYQDATDNTSAHIENAFASAFSNIAGNVSSTMATAIMEGDSLKDGFAKVGKTLATDMLSGLIKVGAQMGINAAMAKFFQAETAITATAAGTAVATAWAPAAALASLASFGSNAGPASAGIASTVALSSSLALTGMAHDGIDRIPREGTWLLQKNERVLSPRQNADLTEYMSNSKNNQTQAAANGPITNENHYHFHGDIYGDDDSIFEKIKDKVDEGRSLIDPDTINGRELAA